MADAVVGSTNGNEFSGATRKSSAEMMYCNVCKIFLNSALQADAHFAGKSHKNKTKRENVEVGSKYCVQLQTYQFWDNTFAHKPWNK